MKFCERFSISLLSLSSQKSRPAKLLLKGAVMLTFTAIFWFTVIPIENSSIVIERDEPGLPTTGEEKNNSISNGLSRQRRDFNRALAILEGAAANDARLTDYFSRVQRRVRGDLASSETHAAIRVVENVKEQGEGVSASPQVAEASALNPVPLRSVWSRVKGLFQNSETSRMATAKTRSESLDLSHQTSSEAEPGSGRLTVGDVQFEGNAAIDRWIKYYTESQGGRQTMQIGIDRSSSYLNLARGEFRQLDVPQDLVWLAHVESVWHSKATSPAAAGGLWQFIPSTALDYGLSVSQENDERLDPMKQTRVAATYLRDLYTIFGDWSLAMAAYNCGEPRVMDAIVKNGQADFWEIHQKQLLPKETLNYVPKILAAIEVASQADNFGF